MGITGVPPKDDGKRRRNADTFAEVTTTVPGDRADVPSMPTPDKWLQPAKDWWDTWVNSPQASMFLETDWQRVKMLLPLVDAYYRSIAGYQIPLADKLMTQIVRNESLLGATHTDRLKGRIKVERPQEAEAVMSTEDIAAQVFGE